VNQLNWRSRDPLHTAHMIKQGIRYDMDQVAMIEAEENPEEKPREVIHRTSNMGAKEFQILMDLKRRVDYLDPQVKASSPVTKTKAISYSGIK